MMIGVARVLRTQRDRSALTWPQAPLQSVGDPIRCVTRFRFRSGSLSIVYSLYTVRQSGGAGSPGRLRTGARLTAKASAHARSTANSAIGTSGCFRGWCSVLSSRRTAASGCSPHSMPSDRESPRHHRGWLFHERDGATHTPASGESNTALTPAVNPASNGDVATPPRAYTPSSTYWPPRSASTLIVSSRGSAIQYSSMPASA